MSDRCIVSASAPEAIGPYSQGMRVGRLVYTSGQLPINSASGELIDNIKEATVQSLENVKAIITQAGGTLL